MSTEMDGATPVDADESPRPGASACSTSSGSWCGCSSASCSSTPAPTKVGHPLTAQRAVQAYEIFPDGIANTIGLALPFLEIILGVLLVLGLFTRPAAIAATLLMVAFIIGISQAWARGLTIDCGCFGGGGEIGADRHQVPAGDRPRRRLRPRRGVAVVAPAHPRLARPHPVRTLKETLSHHGQEARPPHPPRRGRPRSRPPRSPQGSGANKIVVATVVVVVAIIAVVGGVVWSAEPEGGGHRHLAPPCPPARRWARATPRSPNVTAGGGRPDRRPLRGLPVPRLRAVRGRPRLDLPGPGPGQGKLKLNYHVLELPRRQDRRQELHPGGQRRLLRRGRRQVPGVPQRGLRRTRSAEGEDVTDASSARGRPRPASPATP